MKKYFFLLLLSLLFSILLCSCKGNNTGLPANSSADSTLDTTVPQNSEKENNIIISAEDGDKLVLTDEMAEGFEENSILNIRFGDAMLEATFENSPDGAVIWTVNNICNPYNIEQKLDINLGVTGNYSFEIFLYDNCYVITYNTYSIGYTKILSRHGVWTYDNTYLFNAQRSEAYNDKVVTYFLKDGELCFNYQPRKYAFNGVDGAILEYSRGTDEIYMISGKAELWDGVPKLIPEEKIILSDRFTKDELQADLEAFKSSLKTEAPGDIRLTYTSVDQLLKYNEDKFEKFTPSFGTEVKLTESTDGSIVQDMDMLREQANTVFTEKTVFEAGLGNFVVYLSCSDLGFLLHGVNYKENFYHARTDISGNQEVYLFEAGEMFVLEQIYNDEISTAALFKDGKRMNITLSQENNCQVKLFKGINGELLYKKEDLLISSSQYALWYNDYLISRDQFWYEEGYLTAVDWDEVIYEPKRSYTVSDLFAKKYGSIDKWFETIETPYSSLDEFFEANKKAIENGEAWYHVKYGITTQTEEIVSDGKHNRSIRIPLIETNSSVLSEESSRIDERFSAYIEEYLKSEPMDGKELKIDYTYTERDNILYLAVIADIPSNEKTPLQTEFIYFDLKNDRHYFSDAENEKSEELRQKVLNTMPEKLGDHDSLLFSGMFYRGDEQIAVFKRINNIRNIGGTVYEETFFYNIGTEEFDFNTEYPWFAPKMSYYPNESKIDIFPEDGDALPFSDIEKYADEGMVTVNFGDAVIDAECISDGGDRTYLHLHKIEVFGHTVNIESSYTGDRKLSVFFKSGCYFVTDYSHGAGDTYIISDSGIWERHDSSEMANSENFNDEILTLSLTYYGEVEFEIMPRKYLFTEFAGEILQFSTGKNEIYSVNGKATVENGKLILRPEYTIYLSYELSDAELQSAFENLQAISKGDCPETLETLWEENSKKYLPFSFKVK